MSTKTAAISTQPRTVELIGPDTPKLVRLSVTMRTSRAPMTALATDPRPPPSELPPSTAAVRADTSRPTPVSAPVLPMRAAKRKPASALKTDDQM